MRKVTVANYRPIFPTPVCGKLLEHIVRVAVTSHFDCNNITADPQHGLRKRRSCETQLIFTVDDLAAEFKEGRTNGYHLALLC